MLLYDKGYSFLKREYIVPLSSHTIRYQSLKTKNIKSILRDSKYKSVSYEGPSHFHFTFDADTVLTALLGDVWLCYIRMWVQRDSAEKIYPLFPDFCPNWSIVSDYYYSFFCASTLLRLTMRGTIYLDSSVSKPLEQNIDTILGNLYKVTENCTYKIYKDPSTIDTYILDLKPASGQTHETVWKETAGVINLLTQNSDPNSDEYAFLQCLTQVLNKLQYNFPSKLRNAVNYQLPYGINAIEKSIFPSFACQYPEGDRWLDPILNFNPKKDDDFNHQLRLFSAYVKYLDIMVNNLVAEYYDIQGKQCGIQKAINKKRSVPIIFPGLTYTYR